MTYQISGGNQADRAAGAIWLAPMLGKVSATRIATSPGAQAALSALILALTRPGDGVAMEPLVYPGLLDAVRGLDRRTVVLDSDDEGLLPEALARACRERGVSVVYLNPTLRNPTTRTMPASRRRDIVRVAADCDIQIIETIPAGVSLTKRRRRWRSLIPSGCITWHRSPNASPPACARPM